jgi:Kelch motif
MRKPLIAAVCAAAALFIPQAASAAISGSFSPTGSMGTARCGAVAAPLPDGRVLVAGGSPNCSGPGLASAEIYDPATSSFTSSGIGSMGTGRWGAAAAPLPDGRVLVAGGYDSSTLASAEVFNPTTNTFSSAGIGSMTIPRQGAAAAPLPDGQVLIVGGDINLSAEVFDPTTNSFSSAGIGSTTGNRSGAIAASLPDGRVLVAGGGYGSVTAEVFDPVTNGFSSAGIGSITASRGRIDPAAASLPDGRVLVAGGSDDSGSYHASAELFNPATNSFSSVGLGSMGTPRWDPVAAPLPGGRVLIAGGSSGFPSYLSSAEIFSLVETPDAPKSPTTTGPTPTGLRARALKKCKQKQPANARKSCRKKAKWLPV